MIKYFCNRCEKEIKGDIIKINPIWQTQGPENGQHVYESTAERDYCRDCSDEIHAFMMCTAKPYSQTTPPTEEKQDTTENPKDNPKPKPIDKAKILALYKAGWKQKDIAAEMKCSTATVSTVINLKNTIEAT